MFDTVITTMSEHTHHTTIAQLASGLLFGLAALVLALLSQSRPVVAASGYVLLIGTVGVGVFSTRRDSDQRIHAWTAGDVTLSLVGLGSTVVFPGLVLAAALGHFTWTPVATGVAFSVAGLYTVYGIVAITQRLRSQPV